MDDLPLEKIAISGPTLASLIQRLSSSPGDVDGLIFGHVTRISPSNLSDDVPAQEPYSSSSASAPSSSHLIATVTGFISSGTTLSFYDALGRVDPRRIDSLRAADSHLLGWFSARRKTANRPSMREFGVSSSLASQFSLLLRDSENPSATSFGACLFLLFTTPVTDRLIHTHEYRAYQLRASNGKFEPRSIDIVNIGPAFRGHYGCFSPNSPFPLLSCEMSSLSAMNEDRCDESLSAKKQSVKDQKELDACAQGFPVGNLSRLMGAEASNYTGGLEELYEKMLSKIESLARHVENSSAKVFEQENQNRKLRYKVARVE